MAPWGVILKALAYFKRDLDGMRVDENYLDASGVRKAVESEGFEIRWVNHDEVQSLLLQGYRRYYMRVRWWWRKPLINKSGQILLKKPRR